MAAGFVTVTVLDGGTTPTARNFRKWSDDGTINGNLYDVYVDPTTLLPINPASTVPVAGADAHGAVAANNPFGIAGLSVDALPTPVTVGQLAKMLSDKFGRQITRTNPRENIVPATITINASTSAADLFAAGGSGIFLDLCFVLITNTSATATELILKDAAAGTTRIVLSAPANDTRGYAIAGDMGWPQNTANSKWTATLADNIASDIFISALAVKNK